jgi:putative multiple sugar transport system substrate-binding protein
MLTTKRPLLVIVALTILALLLSACGDAATATPAATVAATKPTAAASSSTPGSTTGGKYVGISMPTKSSARWIADGNNMVKTFSEKGYKTDLQYAEDDIPNQVAQIENMVTKGVNVLVIAAIDNKSLSQILKTAKDKKNPGDCL